MPPMNLDLTKAQCGLETTAGTPVAATRLVPFVTGSYTPAIDFKTLEEVRGVMARFDDIKTRQMSTFEITQELDLENILPALLCAFASVTPTGSSPNFTWTFTPTISGALRTLRTATWELALTDGTNHYRRSFAFARPTAISIEAGESTAQISTTWMGRAGKPLAAPANVAVLARNIIPSALFKLSIDDTWAGLGGSDFDPVRSFNWAPDPALEPAYHLQGRDDLDQTDWYQGPLGGALDLTFDHDAQGDAELAHWDAGDLRFHRMLAEFNSNRSIQIDMAGRHIESPDVLAADGRQHTIGLNCQIRADDQATPNILSVEVKNGVAAW